MAAPTLKPTRLESAPPCQGPGQSWPHVHRGPGIVQLSWRGWPGRLGDSAQCTVCTAAMCQCCPWPLALSHGHCGSAFSLHCPSGPGLCCAQPTVLCELPAAADSQKSSSHSAHFLLTAPQGRCGGPGPCEGSEEKLSSPLQPPQRRHCCRTASRGSPWPRGFLFCPCPISQPPYLRTPVI